MQRVISIRANKIVRVILINSLTSVSFEIFFKLSVIIFDMSVLIFKGESLLIILLLTNNYFVRDTSSTGSNERNKVYDTSHIHGINLRKLRQTTCISCFKFTLVNSKK